MAGLRIAANLDLPIDTVTQSMAILARRGAGKTYAGGIVVEEVVKAKVPVVVLDPTGAWWGLRSSVDGERPGLPIVIFGGDHGDIPLERTAGKIIADVVLDHPGAYIVDFSAFESRRAEIEFATHFLERLYRGKKRETGPLLLVVDEADTFAPQNPFGDERRNEPSQKRTLGALEAIVRRGRIKGLGDLLITQRSAVLNKNVLSQTEILIAMQTTAPQDRAAIDDWVRAYGTPEQRAEVMGSIASLGQGEAWFWSPTFLRTLKRVRIRPKKTFDSSRTPEAGETIVPVAFAQIDLERLGAEIQATVEQAKANDPRELKMRIRQFEDELRSRPSKERVVEKAVDRIVERPVLADSQLKRLEALVGQTWRLLEKAQGVQGKIATLHSEILDGLRQLGVDMDKYGDVVPGPRPSKLRIESPAAAPPASSMTLPPQSHPVTEPEYVNGEAKLGKAERAFLAALAQYPEGMTRAKLAILTGYKATSGHISNTLSSLRTKGLIEPGDPIRISDAGRTHVVDVPPLPAPGGELIMYWLGRLGRAEAAFLEAIVAIYPAAISGAEIAERTGYRVGSGHISNTLSALRTRGLIEGPTGAVRASDSLMGT